MDEESINRILAELEAQNPLSAISLKDLQTLLDYTLRTNDSTDLESFYAEISSRNLSLTSLTSSISSLMDSTGPTRSTLSLLASNVYLSLLLSPNSPVLTLFTPMAFVSLLRSIRWAFKNPSLVSNDGPGGENRGRKKRGGGRLGVGKNKGKLVEESENDGEEGVIEARVFFSVLERLELVLGLVHLDRFPDSLRSLVQTVAEIPVVAVEVCRSSGSYEKLCELSSQILNEVLKAEHADQTVSAAEVLKCLTPLMFLPKSQARSFGLQFVVNRMMRLANHSSQIKKAVVNLPKYLVHKAPEKAEPRALAVESIMEIVKVLAFEDQVEFTHYVVKMSQGKGQFRLLSVDLILMLMTTLRDPLGLDSGDKVENLWGLTCLETLIERCSDVTAGIKARALTNLAQVVGFFSGNNRSRTLLKEVMGFGNEGLSSTKCRMNDLLLKRCMDEKAAVRKAALFLISKLTVLLRGALDGELLKIVGMACSDPLVSIRKAAISALSEAFRLFCDTNVTKEWLHSVPPLIADNESSIQEECESLFSELVLDRVSKVPSDTTSHHHSFTDKSNGKSRILDREIELLCPEGVLCILKETCDAEVTSWVKKICTSLGKKKRLKPKIATALQNIIRASESLWLSHSMPIEKWTAPPGAWLLLSEVSAFLPKEVEWEFLHHHWQLVDKYEPAGELRSPHEKRDGNEEMDIEPNSVAWAGDRVFLLQTISNVSVKLPPEPAADLAHNFLKRLEEFNMHSTEVNAHVKALRTLCKRKALNPEEADSLVIKWVHQLLSKASHVLDMYISQDSDKNKNTFLTPHSSGTRHGKAVTASMSKLLLQAITAVYTIGSLVIICPSADLKAIVAVLHTIITSGNSDTKSKISVGPAFSVKEVAPSLYVQAWLTMGKICLADGKLAKRYIPLFVQELEKSDCAALRNNIVVMMADFCVRHTALVDCYMTTITKCLRDPCELVRRQTFVLLARLLQRDYVKWRGVLFLRFLLSLVDESDKIRQLAGFLFGNILKVKAPLLAYNSFVEAIFVLNDCNAHTGRSNPQNSKSENQVFCIRGNDDQSRSKRMYVYVTLLKQMAPEHLLATFAKVCAEILAAASDGMLNLEDITGQSVLQDAFQILCSKEIRIPSIRASSSDSAELEEDGGEGGGSAAVAKGRAITQAVKKGLIQNTVPIFIELKRLLESKNSPLIGTLMECLRVLLKDYKNEIDEILVADKQLQKELIYDMEKYETVKAKSAAAEAIATRQRSETYQSPCDPRIARSGPSQEPLHSHSKVSSAMASAVAATRAQAVLKQVNQGASTPPLSAMSVPKLKSRTNAVTRGEKSSDLIESLRRRQSFDSDEEN
ncbi:condensin-2 complex subunit CAP-D3 [Coffea arabica]|uniref:Condensin-2 complex subunit CAP-D3 n=1 Tax=Coffea arabica TaxID=13443 RepID=A0A6P6WWJ0_COFAR|nr:condensin-2 complex subunit D3-like [Coffea arabica]